MIASGATVETWRPAKKVRKGRDGEPELIQSIRKEIREGRSTVAEAYEPEDNSRVDFAYQDEVSGPMYAFSVG